MYRAYVMSTKEIVDEADKLFSKEWLDHERALIKRMVDNMVAYKRLIPKCMKEDIKQLLVMANRIKTEYDELVVGTQLGDTIELEKALEN